ncbi:MAG: Sec-independent protein translocase protein TatB [Desulfohalobiaceae bacterium]|nr:Sec-independent protein translocase protein TatB [Desulfohalobiaceae bacterium]
MFGIGTTEVLIILAVALLVIGPSKLPEVAKALGKGMAEFKKMSSDMKRTIDMETHLAEMEEEEKKNQDRSATEGPSDDPAAEFSTDPPSEAETDMAESKGMEESSATAQEAAEPSVAGEESRSRETAANDASEEERRSARQDADAHDNAFQEDQGSQGEKRDA